VASALARVPRDRASGVVALATMVDHGAATATTVNATAVVNRRDRRRNPAPCIVPTALLESARSGVHRCIGRDGTRVKVP